MLRGSGFQRLPDTSSVSEHPHPWLKLQHNIMTEHYKAFKSFVISASELTTMLQNRHSQRFIINGRQKQSKKYLVCPTKPLSLLNSKDDKDDNSELETQTSCVALYSGESLLSDQPTTCDESYDVCSEERLSLFDDVKMDDAKDKERSVSKRQTPLPISPVQASVVSSSEGQASVLNNINEESRSYITKLQSRESDVMWSCYANEAAVTSSTFSKDNIHHSPPESSMLPLKDVGKYLFETPPQNNRLNDFSQEDINDLNKRFRHPSQTDQTPNPMPQALDLSRPKMKRGCIRDENVKPLKRRRVCKGNKPSKKDTEEQTAAIDFSLNNRSVRRADDTHKELFYTEESCGADDTSHAKNSVETDGIGHSKTSVRTGEIRHTKKSVGTNGIRHKGKSVRVYDIRHTEKNLGEEGIRHVEKSVRDDVIRNHENSVTGEGVRHTEFSEKSLQILAKMSTSVLTERGQLQKDPDNLVKIPEKIKITTNATVPISSQGINGKAKTHGCNYCGKMFAQRSSVQTHERTHTGVRPYRCEYCGRDFIDCSTYTKHVRLHTGERPYSCDVCGRGFTQSGNMLRHKAARHPEVTQVTSASKKIKTGSVH